MSSQDCEQGRLLYFINDFRLIVLCVLHLYNLHGLCLEPLEETNPGNPPTERTNSDWNSARLLRSIFRQERGGAKKKKSIDGSGEKS